MTETIQRKEPLLVIVGPTASGKTKISLDIANTYNGEIISGDSMQVYRGMDIGTAKASRAEREQIPHHLIDIRNPDEGYSVSEFQQMAKASITDIAARDKLPIIVGGTGLYIESVCYNYAFTEVSFHEDYRKSLMQYAEEHGNEMLHSKLQQVDAQAAERLHPNDTRRIIRALEIFEFTGKTMSEALQAQQKQSPYTLCLIGLTMDRQLLYKRIEERIDEMMEQGLLNEVEQLLAKGYDTDMVSMQALGYKEMIGYLSGEYDLDRAVYLLKRDTRRFAKRQLSWFRRMNEIHWIDVTDGNFTKHLQHIHDIIGGKLY
ncbi:tRNA (adenosine(37)-N6)-dimethylallyltransferase MiaA [Longirhabdus pacifica]|uniref:tRNA (adenosine(37)-N6)-dimethylallyltransferase MiaA n=1 Tax=Longirhabdus pacifica TaxID=2305227 RepID=UPI0010088154|nr:tRNA (adenosine(37)-N6)-dimethylallyltransferase MiaA [Longirhabdus pacifica]